MGLPRLVAVMFAGAVVGSMVRSSQASACSAPSPPSARVQVTEVPRDGFVPIEIDATIDPGAVNATMKALDGSAIDILVEDVLAAHKKVIKAVAGHFPEGEVLGEVKVGEVSRPFSLTVTDESVADWQLELGDVRLKSEIRDDPNSPPITCEYLEKGLNGPGSCGGPDELMRMLSRPSRARRAPVLGYAWNPPLWASALTETSIRYFVRQPDGLEMDDPTRSGTFELRGASYCIEIKATPTYPGVPARKETKCAATGSLSFEVTTSDQEDYRMGLQHYFEACNRANGRPTTELPGDSSQEQAPQEQAPAADSQAGCSTSPATHSSTQTGLVVLGLGALIAKRRRKTG